MPLCNLVQQFLDVGAVETAGAGHGKVRDPIALMVRVTKGTIDDALKLDLSDITIEEIHSTEIARLRRLRVGYWQFTLLPEVLELGATYTVHWRYEMTPGVVNVVRESFVWEPVPEIPHDPANIVIYGTLTDPAGAPVPDKTLVVEEYENPETLTHRTGQITVTSNAFGLWWIELPTGKVVRFVLGDISKVIEVPNSPASAPLRDIPPYQPGDTATDRFGYPLP